MTVKKNCDDYRESSVDGSAGDTVLVLVMILVTVMVVVLVMIMVMVLLVTVLVTKLSCSWINQ